MSEQRISALEHNAKSTNTQLERVETKIDSIAETMNSLVRIEERQMAINTRLSEGTERLKDHDARLQDIEKLMPGLREMRTWVVAGILAGLGLMLTAIAKLVILT